MKEIFDGVVGPVKELYDMLPFHDPDKKYQRALEKLKELKKREHEVYAEIGRRVYKENGAEVPGGTLAVSGDRAKVTASSTVPPLTPVGHMFFADGKELSAAVTMRVE